MFPRPALPVIPAGSAGRPIIDWWVDVTIDAGRRRWRGEYAMEPSEEAGP